MPIAQIRSPPVELHQLLTGWPWGVSAEVTLAVLVLLALSYLALVRRAARERRPWSSRRTAAFLGGLVIVEVALGSGIASYEDTVFTMHVVQLLLLIYAAPPLLVQGTPLRLVVHVSRRQQTTRGFGAVRPVVTVLTHPLVAFLFAMATMYAYFLTPIYQASLEHPLLEDYVHAQFLVAGCLFWRPVAGLDESPRRLGFGARMGYLGVTIPLTSFLGLDLLNETRPIATSHTLADTHTGGAVLWGSSELFTIAALAIVFLQWMREEDRTTERENRRLDAVEAAEAIITEAAARAERGELPQEE